MKIIRKKSTAEELHYKKQVTVNFSSSKLYKNRVLAKNTIIQNSICSQIDNGIAKDRTIEFRSNRSDQRKAYRKAQRLNK